MKKINRVKMFKKYLKYANRIIKWLRNLLNLMKVKYKLVNILILNIGENMVQIIKSNNNKKVY